MKNIVPLLLLIIPFICLAQHHHNKYAIQFIGQVHSGTAGYTITGNNYTLLENMGLELMGTNYKNTLYPQIDNAPIYALYPIIYNTADAHSRNFMSSSYQLTYTGSPTHYTDSIQFDGSSNYANTNFIASTVGVDLIGIGLWVRDSDAVATNPYIGANGNCGSGSGTSCETSMWIHFTGSLFFPTANSGENAGFANTNSIGYWRSQRVNITSVASNVISYHNGSSFGSFNGGAYKETGFPLVIGGTYVGGATVVNKTGAVITILSSDITYNLNSTQNLELYNIFNTFNTGKN